MQLQTNSSFHCCCYHVKFGHTFVFVSHAHDRSRKRVITVEAPIIVVVSVLPQISLYSLCTPFQDTCSVSAKRSHSNFLGMTNHQRFFLQHIATASEKSGQSPTRAITMSISSSKFICQKHSKCQLVSVGFSGGVALSRTSVSGTDLHNGLQVVPPAEQETNCSFLLWDQILKKHRCPSSDIFRAQDVMCSVLVFCVG